MKKTAANYRAMREACGLTTGDIMDEAGVSRTSAKRWERGTDPVPEDVWQMVLDIKAEIEYEAREYASQLAAEVHAAQAEHPDAEVSVPIVYYRSQAELDAAQLAEGFDYPVGVVNAKSRLVFDKLRAMGIEAEFVYRRAEA